MELGADPTPSCRPHFSEQKFCHPSLKGVSHFSLNIVILSVLPPHGWFTFLDSFLPPVFLWPALFSLEWISTFPCIWLWPVCHHLSCCYCNISYIQTQMHFHARKNSAVTHCWGPAHWTSVSCLPPPESHALVVLTLLSFPSTSGLHSHSDPLQYPWYVLILPQWWLTCFSSPRLSHQSICRSWPTARLQWGSSPHFLPMKTSVQLDFSKPLVTTDSARLCALCWEYRDSWGTVLILKGHQAMSQHPQGVLVALSEWWLILSGGPDSRSCDVKVGLVEGWIGNWTGVVVMVRTGEETFQLEWAIYEQVWWCKRRCLRGSCVTIAEQVSWGLRLKRKARASWKSTLFTMLKLKLNVKLNFLI